MPQQLSYGNRRDTRSSKARGEGVPEIVDWKELNPCFFQRAGPSLTTALQRMSPKNDTSATLRYLPADPRRRRTSFLKLTVVKIVVTERAVANIQPQPGAVPLLR